MPRPRSADRPPPAAPGRIRFIFNPRSGLRGRSARLLPLLRDFIAARGLDGDLAVTEGPGHATALAAEAVRAGFQRVAAVGGDGTVNEIAQALRDTPTSLAFLPCGSGNGLARHLGVPGSLREALELLAGDGGRPAVLDTGVADRRLFCNVAGLGLDAEVSLRFNRLARRGLPDYVRAVVGAFRGCPRRRCTITGPDGADVLDVLLVAVANSDQYGNGARLAPGARVDDGFLDLVAVRPVGPAGAMLLGARLFLGTFHRSARVLRRRGARFLIERPAAGPIHTDGETHEAAASIEVRVHPRSLRVVAPAGSGVAAAGPPGFETSVKPT